MCSSFIGIREPHPKDSVQGKMVAFSIYYTGTRNEKRSFAASPPQLRLVASCSCQASICTQCFVDKVVVSSLETEIIRNPALHFRDACPFSRGAAWLLELGVKSACSLYIHGQRTHFGELAGICWGLQQYCMPYFHVTQHGYATVYGRSWSEVRRSAAVCE
jgi:hypothetical protein